MAKYFISIVVRWIFLLIFIISSIKNGKFSSTNAEGVTVSNDRIVLSAYPKDVTIGLSGSHVELPCLAYGENGLKIDNVWRRDDDDKNILNPTESNGSLVLRDLGIQHEGIYQCIILASNIGVLLSGRSKLVVAKSPTFTSEPQDAQASVGNVARFQCTASGIPPATISWFHNGLPLKDDIQRFIVLPSGSLQFFDVQLPDYGSYFCLASNAAGNVTSRKASLSTSEILTPSESPLRFIKSPQNISVTLGDVALFECLFDRAESKSVEFSWERADGGKLPSNDRTQTIGGNLEIRQTTTSDEGLYACVGKSSTETIRSTAYLTVNYAPILRELPQELIKNRGEKARFSCVASGKPRPEIVWYRDGEEITKPGRFKIIPEANHSPDRLKKENGDTYYKRDLIVSSLRFDEDMGTYQCVAKNSYGQTSGAAWLVVKPGEQGDEGPTNLVASVVQSSDAVHLSWDIPAKLVENDGLAVFVIHFYSTELNADKTENTRAVTRYDACDDLNCKIDCCENTNFEAYTKYVFWISAVMTKTSYTPPSNEVEITTADAASAGVALLTVRDSNDDGSVELKWIEPEKNILRGVTLEYLVEYTDSIENAVGIKTLRLPYKITERPLIGLKSGVLYFFRILPKTRAGYPSDESLTNLKDYPWVRHKTKAISNSSSSILPDVMVTVNRTKAFIFVLFERSNVAVDECRLVLSKADDGRILSTQFLTNGSHWSTVFRSLEYSRYYQITVSCVADGMSHADSLLVSRLFRTSKKITGSDQSVVVPPVPFPVNLECLPQTAPKRVKLRWEQLPTGSNVHHYVVRYSPKADDSEILNVSAHVNYKQTSTLSMVFEDLVAGQPYLFAVQTVMHDRKMSKFSDDVTCLSSITAPGQPEITSAEPIGNGTVYVAWKMADDPMTNEKVSSYHVKYKKNGSGDDSWIEIIVNGSLKGTLLTNMTAGQVYIIAVTAENEVGLSQSSNMKHVVVIDPSAIARPPGPSQKVVVSYTEGIIIGICIALVAIIICVLFLCCRWKRSDHGCPIRLSTADDGCTKKSADQTRGGDHFTPKRCPNREMQTLLPPLFENTECDSKGGLDDDRTVRYVTLSVPQTGHSSSTNVDRPISEQKEPLAIAIESSCHDDHPEQYSDLSHSPATGSSLQSWTAQNHTAPVDHNHIPNRYNRRSRRCYHHSSNSSSLSMPNLTDSGIGIDDDSVHLNVRPLNFSGVDSSTATAAVLALNSNYYPPPTNGYYAKHLSWLKNVLTREQQKDRHRRRESKLDAFSNIDDEPPANIHATY